jgi:DnaJ-class molecular chaperone
MPEEGAGADGSGVATGAGEGAIRNPGDQSVPGAPQTGMVTCRDCQGTGLKESNPCPACGGGGEVVQIVGDA